MAPATFERIEITRVSKPTGNKKLLFYFRAQRNKMNLSLLRRTAIAAKTLLWKFAATRLCDTKVATTKVGGPLIRCCIKARTSERTIMETTAKQTPTATASSEIIMLIRKLRWAGLEEKAEQLQKELERSAITDRVVPIQTETD
jgi:hypothetical protein